MSDLFPMLSPETHKPELMAGTSTLSYGGGMASPPSEVGVGMADAGRAAEAASFAGGMSHDVITQLDLIQARAASIVELTARPGASSPFPGQTEPVSSSSTDPLAGLLNTAGHAVTTLLSSLAAAGPDSTTLPGMSEALPSLRFLDGETAIRVAPSATVDGTTNTVLAASGDDRAVSSVPSSNREETPPSIPDETNTGRSTEAGSVVTAPSRPAEDSRLDNATQRPEKTESQETSSHFAADARVATFSAYDVPAYAYAVSNTNGGMETLSFSDNYNQIYPGLQINTAYDDIGDRRDAAWKLPSMRAYPSPDSGYRADQVQLYWKNNADAIGMAIIGTPIPHDRWVNLRDMLHGDIKDHHRGNQETMSKIAHLLATQDNQTTAQLNAIWHNVLGTAIDSASLTNAISQISVGHATLQTERQALAHSSAAASLYARKYQDIHGHPPSEADIRFAQDKIGNGTSLQQYIWDEAHNGQSAQEVGNVYRQVHGREPSAADIDFARQKIGNGASLQQYRWDEAHNAQTAQEFGDVFRQVHGREPTGADIQFAQDKIGNGASRQQYRWDEAHGDAVANQLRDIIPAVQGRPYQDGDAAWVRARQDDLGNGNQTPAQIRQSIARWTADNGGYDATFQAVHGRAPGAGDRNYAATQIGNGWSVTDYRWNEAHSASAAQDYRVMFRNVAGKDPGDGDVQWLQNAVANGSDYVTLRQNLAWSDWGRNAAVSAYRDAVNITPDDATIRSWQGNLADGGSYTSMRQSIVNYHGADAVRQAYIEAGGITPSDDQIRSWVNGLAQGTSYTDMRGTIAHNEGSVALKDIALKVLGRTISPEELATQQAELTNGKTLADLRYTQVHSTEGVARLTQLCVDCTAQQPTAQDLSDYQARQVAGASLTDLRYAIVFSPNTVSGLFPSYKAIAETFSGTVMTVEELANAGWVKRIQSAIADSKITRLAIDTVLKEIAAMGGGKRPLVEMAAQLGEAIATNSISSTMNYGGKPIQLFTPIHENPGWTEEYTAVDESVLSGFIETYTQLDGKEAIGQLEGMSMHERLPWLEGMTGLSEDELRLTLFMSRPINPEAENFPLKGQSQGGPGVWDTRPEGTTDPDMSTYDKDQANFAYQKRITGAPQDIAYVVKGPDGKEVKFDGYDPNTGALLDAKNWKDWPKPDEKFSQIDVMSQIQRQFRAAQGREIDWIVPSEETKQRILQVFEDARFDAGKNNVQIKVVP
ncbi:Tox-REase-5 domain-containing protein [Asaia bogorensis]|nr:Tox-REase-5 domain-containing protein [Asaia bogorensis]